MRWTRRPCSAPHGAALAALSAAAVFFWPAPGRGQAGPGATRPPHKLPTAIRPAAGQVAGVWMELSQSAADSSLEPEGVYRYQETTLTLHPRLELRLNGRDLGPAGGGRGLAEARRALLPRPDAGFWKGFVWMPMHFVHRLERWEQPEGSVEVRRFDVRMGPGQAGLTYFHPFPDDGAAIEFTVAAVLGPAEGGSPSWLGAAAGMSVSVVRDPVLAAAGWEAILEGGWAERTDHRLSGYWRYFANESLVLTLGASIRVSTADLRMSGRLRSSFTWLVRDGLQWEVAVSQPLGGDGPFSVEVGVVTGELR